METMTKQQNKINVTKKKQTNKHITIKLNINT